MKRYRLKRVPVESHSHMQEDVAGGWVEWFDAQEIQKMNEEYVRENNSALKSLDDARVEIEELRTALEAFASEIAFRRSLGYCPDWAFERVTNNQICRTAISHAATKITRDWH